VNNGKAGVGDPRPGPSFYRDPENTLDRVRDMLWTLRDQDGQGSNLQETQRRKAYQAGINRTLEVIDGDG